MKPALAIDLAVKALLIVLLLFRRLLGGSIAAALLTVRIMPRVARDEG